MANSKTLLLYIFLLSGCSSVRYCYFVRHAERLDATPNSALSPEGERRAQALKDLLLSKNIELIFTTNYRRTVETARPLANATNKPLILYKPNAVDSLATVLQGANKNVVVVGHSNTLPPLIEKMSGTRISPIKETEFDNLYVVKIGKKNRELILKKYGTADK